MIPLLLLSFFHFSTQTPSVDEIVAAHEKALSGLDNIHAVKSVIFHGYYHEGTLRFDNTFILKKRPFYRVIGDPAKVGKDDVNEGFDGSAWEYYPDPGIVVRTIGPAANTTRNSAWIDDVLVEPTLRGIDVKLSGTDKIAGKNAYKLLCTMPDGSQQDVYVSPDDWMIVATEKVTKFHAFGKNIKSRMLYSDYREVGGVKWSFSENEIDADTGKTLTESGKKAVDINPDLPDSLFSPPTWTKTPLQEMIQKLYEQRDEPVSVLSTYKQYRAILDYKSETVGAAVDFAGYQCLKMGHADTSIMLLQANVEDHPNFPRAHFGLGRAYRTANRKDEAIKEFKRALEVDPNYKRAKDALAEMGAG